MNGDRRRFVDRADQPIPGSPAGTSQSSGGGDRSVTSQGPSSGGGESGGRRGLPGSVFTDSSGLRQRDEERERRASEGSGAGAAAGAVSPVPTPPPLPNTEDLVPSIALPKGGGAIKSIGEKFEANAFTGSGGTSIPFPTSPARDLTPELSIGYSTGGGNGPYGLGWSLSVPAISRKTDKGLPVYSDREDTFVLAGAEDLVPLLELQGQTWTPKVYVEGNYTVYAYRPRVEAGFSKIERLVDTGTGEVHWRTWSRANVIRRFGQNAASRIADPADPRRVFSWLLDEVRDDRGNVTVFEYKQEDLAGVNTSAPEERERLAIVSEQAQRYLKRIRYGNAAMDVAANFRFEVLFDYGEHDEHGSEVQPWPTRQDTFSSFRSGFDIRTRRLCRRILMIHHFAELPVDPYLVGALELSYDEAPALTLLRSARWRGYSYDDAQQLYKSKALPALEFDYQAAVLDETVHTIEATSLTGLAGGLSNGIQLVDLDGEGLPGILHTRGGHWYYKRNEGGGTFGPPTPFPRLPTIGRGTPRIMDIDGDGHRSVVNFGGRAPGYSERVTDPCSSAAPDWRPHRTFQTLPRINLDGPNVQLIDLNGDGFADVLVAEGTRFTWYPSHGRDGFGEGRVIEQPRDERAGPALVWSDARTAIYFTDMSGDGLSDIVRVRNGEVAYWPSLGHGRFGRLVVLRDSPSFDREDTFHTARLRIGDVDGTGTTDLIYFGSEGADIYRNLSGNAVAERERLAGVPPLDGMAYAEVSDLLGKGTAALVWSTDAPSLQGTHLRYVELLAAGKPYLLTASRNGMGLETKVQYAPSTKYYLEDRDAGTPWKTRLAFPVHVIERTETRDHITGHTFVQTYRYRHGFYDGEEREFRGFGMVEVEDTESFDDFNDPKLFPSGHEIVDEALHVPPVLTKTWFHPGIDLGGESLAACFADEYYSGGVITADLPDAQLDADIPVRERLEAMRSLRGKVLRSEVYALDGSPQEAHPYTVAEASARVRRLQPRAGNRYASFLAYDEQTLTYHAERDASDPRVSQSVVLDVDSYGTVTRQVSVAYPRVGAAAVTPGNKTVNEQTHSTMLLAEADVVHVDNDPASYRLGVPYAGRSYELTGLTLDAQSPKTVAELRAHADLAVEIAYEASIDNSPQKRVLGKQRQTFYKDDLSGALPLGQCGARALPYEAESFAFSQAHLDDVFGTKIVGLGLDTEGAYRQDGGDWYRPSGRVIFDATKFYRVVEARDVFGNASTFTHDTHNLLLETATDPLGNIVSAENDYRLLTPWRTTDANQNRTANAFDELGMVRAVAVMGKDGQGVGDTLDDPTLTLDYNLDAWSLEQKPTWTHATAKETHGLGNLKTQQQFTYHGGMGQVVMAKVQAEPGLAPKRDQDGELVFQNGELVFEAADPRWVGTGRTVLDNKGNVIKQYEPFFSATSDYESEQDLVEWGVTPLLHYDPLGRVVRTDLPDGTFSRVEFTPWKQTSYDPNDTVLDSDWYTERQALTPGTDENDAEIRASNEAAEHANTPSTAHTDHRGRVVVTVAHNRTDGQDAYYETFVDLDVEGNPLEITDARENIAETDTFAPGGVQLYSESVDAGNRWVLADAGGRPLRAWDSRGHARRWSYDALNRPTHAYIKTNQDPEVLAGRSVYGESLAQPEQTNHRGQLFRVYDTAGMVEATSFDFKGNPLSQTRRLATDYTTRPDWIALANETDPATIQTLADALLETEAFTSTQTYDALNRVETSTTPDLSVTTTSYGASGLIASVAVNIKGALQATNIVTNVDYNEKGQRLLEEHGNGAIIAHQYDELTFRVRRIHTTRPNPDPGKREVQDLRYHYDPSGNIAEIRDLAQQVVYFQNAQVAPAQKFVYDAIYRLLSATGREHATITHPTGDEWAAISHPGDAQALQNYTQRYEYDEVGNILATTHEVGGQVAWKRACAYALDGNRLLESSGPGDDPADPQTWTETYTYDTHGNMLKMPHLYVPPDDPGLFWDEDDRLSQTEHGGGGTTYYVYDGAGQRVRKVWVNQNQTQSKERLYFGAWETYRERQGQTLDHERETLHVADGARRMCLIETKTVENGQTVQAASIARYQYDNQLGTATLELDDNADVISYEEFHPYGTSSYRAANGSIDVSAKRYRYTGKERDEETGLAYHGARYYAPWLGRWTAADPIGLGDGINRFLYTRGNPANNFDSTGMKGEALSDSEARILQKEYIKLGREMGVGRPTLTPQDRQSTIDKIIDASDWATAFEYADDQLYKRELRNVNEKRNNAKSAISRIRSARRTGTISRKDARQKIRNERGVIRSARREKRTLRNENGVRGHGVEWSTNLVNEITYEAVKTGFLTPLPGGPPRKDKDGNPIQRSVQHDHTIWHDDLYPDENPGFFTTATLDGEIPSSA